VTGGQKGGMEEDDERLPLMGTHHHQQGEHATERTKGRHKTCLIIFLLGLLALTSAITICYFLFFKTVVPLRVLSLNVWGMPAKVGSEDKELRIKAIGEYIQKAEYDIYLLAELWMRPDHTTIQNLIPEGYFMTEYGDFAYSICDGRVLPTFCSGLATVSKYPFVEKEFHSFTYHGDITKEDGEYWARKGAGRIRVEPSPGITVDAFVTHTCAVGSTYTNAYYREKQVAELVKWTNASDADFVILGGDFNTSPNDTETSYQSLKDAMVSSMEEFFQNIKEWLCPKRATYGNPYNTYSNMYAPVLYDYIWHRAQGKNMIWTNFFDVPFLKTIKILHDSTEDGKKEKLVSFSDHEAVTSSLLLWKSIF